MPLPNENTFALWVRNIEHVGVHKISSVIEAELSSRTCNCSIEERLEHIEKILPKIINRLQEMRDECMESGINPDFSIDEDGYYTKHNTNESKYLNKINQLSSTEFEIFCTKILQELGGEAVTVGGKNDGGVDFSAKKFKLSRFMPDWCSISVIGQAKNKRSDNKVCLNELRTFVGGSIFRINNPSDPLYKDSILKPVVFAYWITTSFEPSASDYAKQMGIWALNGLGIASLGIECKIEI